MNVLGISAFYHDSAACLTRDGLVVAAAQEERFTRRRFDPSFPIHAIRSCLAREGLGADDIDVVAFYEKPLLRFDRAMAAFVEAWPAGRAGFVETAPAWVRERLRLRHLLRVELGYRGRITYCAHHEAHAASAFFPSPFEDAAVLTLDGVGEWTTNTVGRGRGADLVLSQELRFPHSLGLFYAGITEYLGMEILSDEYKVMGLAAYGSPRFAPALRERVVDLRDDGSYRLDLAYFRFLEGRQTIDPTRFAELFGGPPRAPDGPLDDRHRDVAASAQLVLEEALLAQARHAHARSGATALVLAGGVALNAVANGRITRDGPFRDVWIQPAAGDAGGALGAALLTTHRVLGAPRVTQRPDGMRGALLGPDYDHDASGAALRAAGLVPVELASDDHVDEDVARRLSDGQVVGVFLGRAEFGPRALGSRSILADARRPDAQARVNERIKFREGYRPFAPAVLAERADAYFAMSGPSPYMLQVAPVRVPDLPGVTHVDGSARVQTVDADRFPRLARLLAAFDRRTGCPLVLNTSFNLRGEPIVGSPANAIGTFLASEMDALVLGRWVVDRPAGPARPLPPPPPPAPTRSASRAVGRDVALLAAIAGFAAATRVPVAPAWLAAALFAWTAAIGLGLTARARPEVFAGAARAWAPTGAVVGRVVGAVLLSVAFWLVVGPVALVRRRTAPPAFPTAPEPSAASYWQAWQPPRGGPDRMF